MIPIAFIYFSAGITGIFTSLALAEKVGRRSLLLFAIGSDLFALFCMMLADIYAPSRVSSFMGFLSALVLTLSLVIGLDKLPMLLLAELVPQGEFTIAQPIRLQAPARCPPRSASSSPSW